MPVHFAPYDDAMHRERVTTGFSITAPIVGVLLVVATWGSNPSWAMTGSLVFVHVALVLVSVAHAEAIARRVGEPYGTLVLALAVTVIEVSLIVTLMTTGADGAPTLARDSIFAVIMIVCNGLVGRCKPASIFHSVRHWQASV